MILQSITEYIGNTPLLLIPESVHGIVGIKIYAKLEYLNPFGSIKDRTALGILKKSGDTDIIESSSGNTAKALGILANLNEKKFLTVTNRIKQKEVEDILRIIWVAIESLPPWSECPDPHDPNSPFWVIQRIIDENPWKYYWTDQYTNTENPKIHEETTAPEIDRDIWVPDYFFSWLWTTGSSRGIIEYFEKNGGTMQSIWVITAWWSYIPWIRNSHEMSEVGLFIKKYYENILPISDQDAIDSMLILIRKCGILAWPTTWAIFHGLLEFLHLQDPVTLKGKKALFIACDRMESYTSYLQEKRPGLFDKKKKDNEKPFKTWPLKTISRNEIENERHLLIDMRSYSSYEINHVPGSISFPYQKLQDYLSAWYLPFPKEKPLIFMCPFWEESRFMCQIANGLWYESYSLWWWLNG